MPRNIAQVITCAQPTVACRINLQNFSEIRGHSDFAKISKLQFHGLKLKKRCSSRIQHYKTELELRTAEISIKSEKTLTFMYSFCNKGHIFKKENNTSILHLSTELSIHCNSFNRENLEAGLSHGLITACSK